jgi:alpha-galactosidase
MSTHQSNLFFKTISPLQFQLALDTGDQVIGNGSIDLQLINELRLDPESFTTTGQTLKTQTKFGLVDRVITRWQNDQIEINLIIDHLEEWNDAFILQCSVRNIGKETFTMLRMSMPGITLSSHLTHQSWCMQGVAVEWGQDFAFPLTYPFQRENDLGHTDNGESGGIPMLYFWNKNGGLAFAHLEPTQELWHMPVSAEDEENVTIALEKHEEISLAPGESFSGLHALISFHRGDFYASLALYRDLMKRQGLSFPETNDENHEAAWCSWGYEFDVKPEEMLSVLPQLKEMNIHWLTLDDRWFDHYGDWNPRADTFPGGVGAIKSMVDEIHANNAYAQLWWYPLCVEDGVGEWDGFKYGHSQILNEHPDWLVLNEDGSVARNNRGLAILCPAVIEVQKYSLDLTRMFIEDWGFDGHKLDNIYTVPPCHNPAHHHEHPMESVYAFAEIYRKMFELTRALKPDSVTQICPCGTQILHTLIPAMDQAVTADPTSSRQIRRRVKFYKGLLGARSAIFADHIELTDDGMDFASELGTGGILATKFIREEDEAIRPRLQEWWGLDREKELIWKKWFVLYKQLMLSKEEYLNLYDIAFDSPESHVIRKGDEFYFAFYTPESNAEFSGDIEFRGLEQQQYQLIDYVNEKKLGTINGPTAKLSLSFRHALLVKAVPLIK